MTTITGVRIDAGVDEKIQHVHLDGRDLLRALYDTLSCGTIETAALRGGVGFGGGGVPRPWPVPAEGVASAPS